jgi:hypothetical protein
MLCSEKSAVQSALLAHFLHRGEWFCVLAARQCVETGLYHLVQQSKFLYPIGCVRVPWSNLGRCLDLVWPMWYNAQPSQFSKYHMRKGIESAAVDDICCTGPHAWREVLRR